MVVCTEKKKNKVITISRYNTMVMPDHNGHYHTRPQREMRYYVYTPRRDGACSEMVALTHLMEGMSRDLGSSGI